MALPSLAQSLTTAIQATKQRLAQSGDDSDLQFLKLQKDGLWVYGADDTEVAENSVWAVDPNTLMTGFIAWPDEGEPVGEEMASIMDAPIQKGSLPDVGEQWRDQIGFCLICIEGDDAGAKASFKSTALGGRKAFKVLLDAILERATAGEEDLVPVIFLGQDSYKHKKYGKIYTPEFDVVEWSNHDDLKAEMAGEEGKVKPALEEKQPEPEPEPEPEPTPAKRTRRSRKKA